MAETARPSSLAAATGKYVFNTFCFGYNVGYSFIKTRSGYRATATSCGIGADDCQTAVGRG